MASCVNARSYLARVCRGQANASGIFGRLRFMWHSCGITLS